MLIGGIMEHVEEAGVHSGDSACALPPQTLSADVLDELDAAHPRDLPTRSAVAGRSTSSTR